MVIAIDGPAGAGKSSVARAAAERLGFTYLDSGAMYRAVACRAESDGADAAEVARTVRLETSDLLHEAIALYRSAGYEEVPAFNDEPFAHHWFAKDLGAAPRARAGH